MLYKSGNEVFTKDLIKNIFEINIYWKSPANINNYVRYCATYKGRNP